MADRQVNSRNEARVLHDKTSRCDVCNTEITYKHFARHQKMAKHITNWNRLHNINDAQTVVKKDTLKQRQERFKELPRFIDLNLESEQKEKVYLNNYQNMLTQTRKMLSLKNLNFSLLNRVLLRNSVM